MNYLSAGKESNQVAGTPPDLVAYVKSRWPIGIDLAANRDNSICGPDAYLGEDRNSLECDWQDYLSAQNSVAWPRLVGWLNPPYNKLDPWMAKSSTEAKRGAHTVCLVPASIESGWFTQHVYGGPCTVHVLKGRLKFVGYTNVAGQGHMLVDFHGGAWGGIHLLDWRAK